MKKEIDIFEIMELLPHRYPFLLIDKIIDYDENIVIGKKCVTMNEPFFQGHFPMHPIMPGVLIIESLAQTGAVFLMNESKGENKMPYFARIDKVKFKKPVRPGDVLINKCELISKKNSILKIKGQAFVDDVLVCEGEFTAVIVENNQ